MTTRVPENRPAAGGPLTLVPSLLCGLFAALLLSACNTPGEPIHGCTLAAANEREILRAKSYLHPAITSRLLRLRFDRAATGHVALIFRLDEGWCAYDDGYGTRRLDLPRTAAFPPPLVAARAAYPGDAVAWANWY